MTRLFLVDDHTIMRDGLRALAGVAYRAFWGDMWWPLSFFAQLGYVHDNA